MGLKSLLFAGLLALAPAFALAGPEGTYKVQGSNPDGTTYTGLVQVTRNGETYNVVWKIGDTEFVGTGLGAKFIGEKFQMGPASAEDSALSVGYISGRSFGMAMYFKQPDETWLGVWTFGGSDKSAPEVWTPAK